MFLLILACTPSGDSTDKTTDSPPDSQADSPGDSDTDAENTLVVTSVFAEGERIPDRYTCSDQNVSPPLSWTGAPENTAVYAIIVDDPDAPGGTWLHWTGWNLATPALQEGEAPPIEGTTDFGSTGYGGPCPPKGDGDHRYYFRIYALSYELRLAAGSSRSELEASMEGSILATGTLMGTFSRE